MRVTRFGAMALGFATLLFTMTLIGCGGSTEKDKVSETGGKDKGETTHAKKTGLKPGKGTFKGKVTLVGDIKPTIAKLNEELKMQMDKASAADKPHCLKAPKEQLEQQDWKVGPDNGVAEVFVYFKANKDKFFEFSDSDEAVKAAKNADIDQPHCAFVPHTLTLFAKYYDSKNKSVKTGKKLVIHNSSDIAHNTKFGDFNESIPSKSKPKEEDVDTSYTPIDISCKVHPWMTAYLLALDHPYVAITNEKGEFEIKNVPVGKVQVLVNHPKSGTVVKGEEIDLKDGENKKDFEIKAK